MQSIRQAIRKAILEIADNQASNQKVDPHVKEANLTKDNSCSKACICVEDKQDKKIDTYKDVF